MTSEEWTSMEEIKDVLVQTIKSNEFLNDLNEEEIQKILTVLDRSQFTSNDNKVKKELQDLIPKIAKRIVRAKMIE